MSHAAMGRRSPLACPLATLGRASPPLEPPAYHHPLSSSPLDPHAYLSRNPQHHDRDSPTLEKSYQPYARSRNTPSIEPPYRTRDQGYQRYDPPFHARQSPALDRCYPFGKKSTSSVDSHMTYHLSRSSSSSLDQPYIHPSLNPLEPQVYHIPRNPAKAIEDSYLRQSPATFDASFQSRQTPSIENNEESLKLLQKDLSHLTPSVYKHQSQAYQNKDIENASNFPLDLRSPSLDSVYQERYQHKNEPEQYNLRNDHVYSASQSFNLRSSSPTMNTCNYLVENFSKLGRSSPSLDQGYHTLVSPSPGPSTPGPWTDLSPGVSNFKGKRILSKNNSFDKLPDDAVIKIFMWLDSCDLCSLARVCRRFETLAWQPCLWRTITLKGEHLSGDKAMRGVFRRLCGLGRTGACPSVERVFLGEGCKVTDRGLALLARRCPELTHLQLHGSAAVSSIALRELTARCTNLQHLDITGCSRITSMSNDPPRRLLLQYLDLTDCAAIEDLGLKAIVRACPQLVYLYLRRCTQITDDGLKFVPSFCSGLRELSVSDCSNITDFGLYELSKLGATLRYLSVAKCDQVSDAGLKVIARRCYKLRYLNARGCEAVSDDAITVLARFCPRLRALDIGKCDVSDAGLRALAESCPNLKKLSLRNCDLVTDRGVQCVAYYCRGLQQLNIQDCQISLEGYRAVKKYCKRCVIEHTNPGFY
ncbi:F-box and leucine-rich repeat protein 7 [Arctopsyche grandis]|uniref:F-box and leucine-rich repeat protein 7 n=1 Tax=Arctopsyche grandis TaxID=121162 RepID=UPI00406D912D